jgi:predicted N-acyltransferase
MDFDIQITHSIEEIGEEAWNCLKAKHPFSSYRWYRFGEAVLTDNTPVYIILSYQNKPVARATFWLRRREQLPISSAVARHLVEALLRRWPVLVCQAPLVEAPGLILPEDQPLRSQAINTIAQAAQEQAQRLGTSYLAYTYLERSNADDVGWPEHFMAMEYPNPKTYMCVRWPDFETYLRNTSRSIRRNYQKAAERGIETKLQSLREPLTDADLADAMRLIQNVNKHYHAAPNPWARTTYKHAHMVDGTWVRAKMGDRLVCCCLLLGDGDTYVLTLLGRDYDVQYAYFHMFCSGIGCAIEKGARTLWGGSATYDIKRRLKFQLMSPHYDVFAASGSLFQRISRWAMKYVE